MMFRICIEQMLCIIADRKNMCCKAMSIANKKPSGGTNSGAAFYFGSVGYIKASGNDIYTLAKQSGNDRRKKRIVICKPKKIVCPNQIALREFEIELSKD